MVNLHCFYLDFSAGKWIQFDLRIFFQILGAEKPLTSLLNTLRKMNLEPKVISGELIEGGFTYDGMTQASR